MTDGVRELLGKEYIAKKNQEPPSFHEFPSLNLPLLERYLIGLVNCQ